MLLVWTRVRLPAAPQLIVLEVFISKQYTQKIEKEGNKNGLKSADSCLPFFHCLVFL